MELYKTPDPRYTVILCSFLGATSKIRSRYAEVLARKGCSIATMGNGFNDPNSNVVRWETDSSLSDRSKVVLDNLIANGLDRQLLIFYLQSEGGMRSWLSMMKHIDSDPKYEHMRERIVGYILDSCPWHWSLSSGFEATYGTQPFWPRMGYLVLWILAHVVKKFISFIPGMTRLFPYLTMSSGREYREKLYNRYISNLPQLFIYSKGDTICSHAYISNYIQRRSAQLPADTIDSFLVDDAPHCQILRVHPKPFSDKIDEFLARLPRTPVTKL